MSRYKHDDGCAMTSATDNRTTELLPCPWCGEYPKVAEDGGSTGPWFCVWHDCPPVEGGKARHYGESLGCISISTTWFHTEAEAIAAWNTRAELSSEPPYDELLRCLENDWHISASWDGLRKFWCIELTEEGVRLCAAAHDTLTAEQVREAWTGNLKRDCLYDPPMPDWQAIADELREKLGCAIDHAHEIVTLVDLEGNVIS